MQNELVSVVLPIYNVEKYLNRCIDSIVGQTYRNLEIILVDDGSPDRCPRICDEWAAKDSRIRVIHKQNAGLGMARNTGIENAHGSYICFFDSDDYIALNAIELAYTAIRKHDAQVLCFGLHNVNSSGRILRSIVPACPKEVFSGAEVQEIFLPNLIANDPAEKQNWNLTLSAWAAMYSMDLIRETGWRFVSEREILSEDVYSILQLYKDVRRAAVLAEPLYFYCMNQQSLSRVYRPDRFERNVSFYNESLKLCQSCGYSDAVKLRLTRYLFSNTIGALKQLMHSSESPVRKLHLMQAVVRHEIWRQPLLTAILHHESPARRILLWCILHRCTLFCCLFSAIKR